MFEYFFKRPYLLFAVLALFTIFGLVGLKSLPKNLFPDSERPTAIIITQVPGASAKLAASTVSKPIEEEMARLPHVRQISSTSLSGVSIVKIEFEYVKGLDSAISDTTNAFSVVKPKLPSNALTSIYAGGSFLLPVEIVSISAKENSINLDDIRAIVEGDIKPKLLASKKFGNIEIFGGNQKVLKIDVDLQKLKTYNLALGNIVGALKKNNKDIPFGFSKSQNNFMTIGCYGEKLTLNELQHLFVAPNVRLKDVANLAWTKQEQFSAFVGNGKESIALAIQRPIGGSVLTVSDNARGELEILKSKYPNLNFEIVDTQRELIKTANDNMLEALRDAVIFVLLVLLLFLGNFKALIAAGITIPLVFLGTIGTIYLMGGELNIVIYTAIILALGMLVDNAVVVLENIERHLTFTKDVSEAVTKGTKEVIGAVFAGTVATGAVIVPLMFVGDFPQTIYRPLIVTLIIALIVSYFLSITFIPWVLDYLYKKYPNKTKVENLFEVLYQKSFGKFVPLYVGALEFTSFSKLRRVLVVVGMIAVLVLSVKNVMPLIGKDTLPPMDTGIIKVNLAFSPNETTQSGIEKVKPFLSWLHSQKEVVSSAVSFGTEAGTLSLGNGNLPTEATITINCVNRFERNKTIWEIEKEIQRELHKIEGINKVDVFDFGATAISSIKAPLNIRLSSNETTDLQEGADKIIESIKGIKGLTSISKSWSDDQMEAVLDIDTNKALTFGITPYDILMQLPLMGQIVGYQSNFEQLSAVPIRLYSDNTNRSFINNLQFVKISTQKGEISLGELAKIKMQPTQTKIERTNLLYTVDINAYRQNKAITHITDEANLAIKDIKIEGVKISQEGDIVQLDDSLGRMVKAIGMGLALLFLALSVIYSSATLAFIMIITLPFAMIGAGWGMLIFDKPSCMPSMLGILLLFGILIKNSILLVDFYKEKLHEGLKPYEAAKESIILRYRPVMMTAFATIAGMIPVAFEWSIGLEKLSPLADVAIGGLLVGTILILYFVPMMVYSMAKKDKNLKAIL